mmetsp:Transcript_26382/g.37728  ORF Transcript_26382/g.37728 Transcript_26382/m.37728 type:complete len:116 (+) Transcript_26382:301-648(+)
MDTFEMMDEDHSRYATEYIGVEITGEKLEKYFHKYDYNYAGLLDYFEFCDIFIELGDVRKQLELRKVDVPSFVRKKTLRLMLLDLLVEEERKERRALVCACTCSRLFCLRSVPYT